jgi:hypothetical protein
MITTGSVSSSLGTPQRETRRQQRLCHIVFEIAVIDSWDGGTGGSAPDFLNFAIDGVAVTASSWENVSPPDHINPGTVIVGPTGSLGFASYVDSAYRISLFTVGHSSSTLDLSWFASGAGWQGGDDESWAIDNIRITTNSTGGPQVPEPTSLLLLVTGLSGLGVFARRKR